MNNDDIWGECDVKVLAIVGSPRKGNSYKMTQLVEERMKNLGDVEFEYLFLKDMDMGRCTGCHVCVTKGEDKCPSAFDQKSMEEKMMAANGVIFVTPTYSFHISGLMKCFVDYFTYCVHRPRFFGRQAMVFVLRGDILKDGIKYMVKVAKSWGFNVPCTLGVAELESLTPRYRDKTLKDVYKKVDMFYNAIRDEARARPTLYDLIGFRIWRMNAIACRESIAPDYEYWNMKGWLDKTYYYDVKVNIFKRAVTGIVESLSRSFMIKIFGDVYKKKDAI